VLSLSTLRACVENDTCCCFQHIFFKSVSRYRLISVNSIAVCTLLMTHTDIFLDLFNVSVHFTEIFYSGLQSLKSLNVLRQWVFISVILLLKAFPDGFLVLTTELYLALTGHLCLPNRSYLLNDKNRDKRAAGLGEGAGCRSRWTWSKACFSISSWDCFRGKSFRMVLSRALCSPAVAPSGTSSASPTWTSTVLSLFFFPKRHPHTNSPIMFLRQAN